jgi:hypothetical protein
MTLTSSGAFLPTGIWSTRMADPDEECAGGNFIAAPRQPWREKSGRKAASPFTRHNPALFG